MHDFEKFLQRFGRRPDYRGALLIGSPDERVET